MIPIGPELNLQFSLTRPNSWSERAFAESCLVWTAPESCGSMLMSRLDIARELVSPREGHEMHANPTTAAVVLLASVVGLSALVVPASADAISDWVAKTYAVATEQRESPRSRARTLAIVNVAMFEAINAVERDDTPHSLNISADRNTSIEAAAASATWRRPEDMHSARTRLLQPLRCGSPLHPKERAAQSSAVVSDVHSAHR